MDKFFSHMDAVITDAGCLELLSGIPIPEDVTDCDSKDIQTALNIVLTKQKDKRVLVVTSSQAFCNLLLACNQTVPKNKLAVFCGETLHAEDAMAEILREEKTLHTADGAEHFPVSRLTDALFANENGELLLYDGGADQGEMLYDADEKVWGCALNPEIYHAEDRIGNLSDVMDDFSSLREKALICRQLLDMFEAGRLCAPKDIVVFRTDTGMKLLETGDAQEQSPDALLSLLYAVYFAQDPNGCKDKLQMLISDRLANPDYPAYLFEDFVMAFAGSVLPDRKLPQPDIPLLRNTIDRILITTKEES